MACAGSPGPQRPPCRNLAAGSPQAPQFRQAEAGDEGILRVGHDRHPVPRHGNRQVPDSSLAAPRLFARRHRPRSGGDVGLSVAEPPETAAGPGRAQSNSAFSAFGGKRRGDGFREREDAVGAVDLHHVLRAWATGLRHGRQHRARMPPRALEPPLRQSLFHVAPESAWPSATPCNGRLKPIAVPEPRVLSAETSPPMLTTKWRTMAKPRPVPPAARDRPGSTL